MSYWGKVLGGMAGFFVGGPLGAMVGAALGHAADSGGIPQIGAGLGGAAQSLWSPARIAAMFGRREQLFAIAVVALSAKLAKCDGIVNRAEIDAFKRSFSMPPDAVREIGRLFDQARDSQDGFEEYAEQLGAAFADNKGVLEDVLVALFAIARADGALHPSEIDFLRVTHRAFGLDRVAWDRARGGAARPPRVDNEPDPYAILGVTAGATPEEIRTAWKRLMRENHPDSLAARGVPAAFIERASAKVATINAAWDRIKRERGL